MIDAPPETFSPLKSVLARRLAFLGILLVAEWLPGRGGQSLARWVAAFASLFLALTYLGNKRSFERVSRQLGRVPIGWGYLAAHLCFLGAYRGLSLPGAGNSEPRWEGIYPTAAWLIAGGISIALAAFAFVPPKLWRSLVSGSYGLLVGAAGGGIIAWQFVPVLWSNGAWPLWRPITGATFHLVVLMLRPFLPRIVTDSTIFEVGSDRFVVTIGSGCSGLEGIGLFLVFVAAWLWFCRRECRFPNALALIPAGMAVMWLLNGVRLAALILIGHAGYPKIALGGFHSQAGFLAFSCVAISVLVAAHRVPWWSKREPSAAIQTSIAIREVTTQNPAAWYLVPFLVVLAAGMIGHAASSGFEWLYPLRFFAAAAALWSFRGRYADLDWSFGWFAPFTGAMVFAIWLVLDPGSGLHPDALTIGLAALPAGARIVWIALRILAAVLTVPIVEELAFRGFLIRRLMSADFEALDTKRYTLLSLGISSLAFGLLHGDRWLAGSIAGALYALVFVRRGKMGDAVIAHATSNALLAAWVLMGGKWYLW